MSAAADRVHGYGRARSWLYAPGHRDDLVASALGGDADAVVIDLEDAVPAARKAAARATLVALAAQPRTRPLWARMNPPGSVWGRDDAAALATADVDGVRLPKASDPAAVARLAERLHHPLHLLIESALGLERAFALATAHPDVVGLSLGEADLAADLRVRDHRGLWWARERIVVASRAAGLASPVAAVWTDLADPAGLAADSVAARDRGFHGRSVIHPRQVAAVHRAFAAPAGEHARAHALLAAAGEHDEAAFTDADGRFVDPAVLAGARALLDRGPDPEVTP